MRNLNLITRFLLINIFIVITFNYPVLSFILIGFYRTLFLINRKDIVKIKINEKIDNQINYNQLDQYDQRSPFLYLRGFKIDGQLLLESFFDIWQKTRLPDTYINDYTLIEEKYINNYNIAGPVITLENPSYTQEFGIIRFKNELDDWKEIILDKIKEARLILLIPDYSEGIIFELDQILNLNYLEKLVIVLQFGNDKSQKIQKIRFRKFKEFFEERYHINIPDYIEGSKYLIFDSKNKPLLFKTEIDVLQNKNILYENRKIYILKKTFTNLKYLKKNKPKKVDNKFVTFSFAIIASAIILPLLESILKINIQSINLINILNMTFFLGLLSGLFAKDFNIIVNSDSIAMVVFASLIITILAEIFHVKFNHYSIYEFFKNSTTLVSIINFLIFVFINIFNSITVFVIFTKSSYESELDL